MSLKKGAANRKPLKWQRRVLPVYFTHPTSEERARWNRGGRNIFEWYS